MLNLDPGKLLVIAVVAIILLGPDRLPQVARQVGGAWRSFNEFRHRMESEVRNTMPDLPPTSEIARLARSPSALLNHLSNMSPDEEAGRLVPTADAGGRERHGRCRGGAIADAAPGVDPAEPERTRRPTPAAGTGAAPASPPRPPPIHVERPPRAPQPSGVVVPGDPTLN